MDPIRDLEEKTTQQDLGVMGYRVYQGARQEGASLREAFLVVVAFFQAMFAQQTTGDE